MYMYLQKQLSWILENFTPFLTYTTLIYGWVMKLSLHYVIHNLPNLPAAFVSTTVPGFGVYVLITKLQLPETYIGSRYHYSSAGNFQKGWFGKLSAQNYVKKKFSQTMIVIEIMSFLH